MMGFSYMSILNCLWRPRWPFVYSGPRNTGSSVCTPFSHLVLEAGMLITEPYIEIHTYSPDGLKL